MTLRVDNPDQAIERLKKTMPMEMAKLASLLTKDANSTFHQSTIATSGITAYDLQAPALSLYPLNTPLRNWIPREGGGTGIQANWRAITAINPGGVRAWKSPGNRGAVIGQTTTDYTAAFRGLSSEVNTDFEAQWAAKGFDDPRALATLTGLRSLMLSEELAILGGDSSVALGTTPTPNLADVTTGGTLLHSTAYYVVCVALTLEGNRYASVANGVQAQIAKLNADGTTDIFGGGAAKVSAEATITTGAGVDTRSLTVSLTTAVPCAAAYAWYIGTATGVERLAVISTSASATITALPAGTNQLSSSLGTNDNSTCALAFDGLITQAFKSGSGAYLNALGATLTGDSAGGVKEIDAMLKSQWDNFQLGPTDMLVGSQIAQDLGVKITTGSSTAALRFNLTTTMGDLSGGIAVSTYKNKFSLSGVKDIQISLHPNMPGGMIFAFAKDIPYPLSGVGNAIRMLTRQEYNQIDWPLRSMKWESSVNVDEVLQCYAPFSMGVLYDVRPG